MTGAGVPYQEGNTVTLDATFDEGTTPTDPDQVTFRVRLPDNTLETYVYGVDPEVVKLGVGVYELQYGTPSLPGQYHWDANGVIPGGTFPPSQEWTVPGEFYVIPSSVVPPDVPPGPVMGPCTTWIDGMDVARLCGADYTLDAQLLDAVAVSTSMLAFEASGRQFPGICERVVRPCSDPQNTCWPYNWGAGIYPWWGFGYGWGWGWYGPPMGLGGNQTGPLCGCQPLSRVKLAGYPAKEILEVKIDGAVLPELDTNGNPNYRLDGWTWLTRMADPTVDPPFPRQWPNCQDLALDDTHAGTFSVSYRYGDDPPPLGVLAAEQLACELYSAMTTGICKLPNNVTRVVRQGVTFERVTPLAMMLRTGATGIIAWDMFMAEVNPYGLRRRPAIWSPDVMPYAPRLGST